MLRLAASLGFLLAAGMPAAADSYWDLESARANARAGGPVSEHDAELLERYGCLSGTRSKFCEERERRQSGFWRNRDRRSRDER